MTAQQQSEPTSSTDASSTDAPITILVELRRKAELPSTDPLANALPADRPHLDLDTFTERYGADPEAIKAIEQIAAREGIEVLGVDQAASLARLRGAPSAVSRAFGAQSEQAGLADEDPAASDTTSAGAGDAVKQVLGTGTSAKATRSWLTRRQETSTTLSDHDGGSADPDDAPPRSYSAPQIAKLYDYPPYDGAGQCVGVIELWGGFTDADMTAYFSSLGLATPEIICVGENEPGKADTLSNMEVTMDVQIVGALCPRSRVVVYFPNSDIEDDCARYVDACARAIFDRDNRPSVLSVSWSFPEIIDNENGISTQFIDIVNRLLIAASWLGVTVCTSTGDSGSLNAALGPANQSAVVYPVPNFAATSPHALGCGGTTLEEAGGAIRSEIVWNRLAEHLSVAAGVESSVVFPMASGGGVSRQNPLPDYQQRAGVPPSYANVWKDGVLGKPTKYRGRGVPDVAANADLNTGWQFYFNGTWAVGGGTSVATPAWAALVTLINQGLGANQKPGTRAGWLNPLLYRLQIDEGAGVMRPITEGSNGGYSASPSRPWSACAGLGAPDGVALARALGAMSKA